jgi:hypothetical protein
MRRTTMQEISDRSSVGITALKAMVNAGVEIKNHSEIADYILNKPANHRPTKWRGGYVAETSTRNTTEAATESLEELELEPVDVSRELKKLNSMMAATNSPDAVDMLAKKISSLHKAVVTDEKLSGLIPQSLVDERERVAFSILTKFMQRLFLEMPASLVGLEVDQITKIIQGEVESTVSQIMEKLESEK